MNWQFASFFGDNMALLTSAEAFLFILLLHKITLQHVATWVQLCTIASSMSTWCRLYNFLDYSRLKNHVHSISQTIVDFVLQPLKLRMDPENQSCIGYSALQREPLKSDHDTVVILRTATKAARSQSPLY